MRTSQGVPVDLRSRVVKPAPPVANRSLAAPGTPEFEVLLCCARAHLEPQHSIRIQALLENAIDWQKLIDTADPHGMLPLLYWHLQAAHREAVPEPVLESLREAFTINAGRALRYTVELLEVLQLFEANGIPAVAYKGPVLAAQLYGNVALRRVGDLDVLLPKADYRAARELLLQRGYHPRVAFSPAERAFLLQSGYHEALDHAPSGIRVELHWAFTKADFGVPLDFEALAPRLERTAVLGRSIATFSKEDLLLILCIHGSKHRWKWLEWSCGLAELVRAYGEEIDWEVVLRRATGIGTRRMLLVGLTLARDLLQAPLPPEVLQEMHSDRRTAWLAREVTDWHLRYPRHAEEGTGLTPHGMLFYLRLRERLRDRLRFLSYVLTTPTEGSWNVLLVGNHSLPLHLLGQPFRLVQSFLAKRFAGTRRPDA